MSIETKDMDRWDCVSYGLPYPLYMYYLDDQLFTDINTAILGNSSAIQSVQYTPFLEPSELTLFKIPYDVSRFGNPDSIRPDLDGIPDVYRIMNIKITDKLIGKFNTYDIKGLDIGGPRNWRNESRLYNYPYAFCMLTDYLNPPMTLKYHLMYRREKQDVKVKVSISDRCSYGLYVDLYKNDVNGTMESMVSGDAHELPCSSSAYSQWFASSKNQAQFGQKQALQESFMRQRQGIDTSQMDIMNNSINSIAGIIGAGMTGDLGTLAGATVGGLAGFGTHALSANLAQNQMRESGRMQRQGIQGSMLAQQKDLRNTPNTLITMGSDVIYGIVNGQKKVDLIRYWLTEEFGRRLGDYFALYGYKQNRLMRVDTRNRYYYNYIKTVGANLISHGMPREHLESLKQIYDTGVTIWHIDRIGVTVGDYSKDNYEV